MHSEQTLAIFPGTEVVLQYQQGRQNASRVSNLISDVDSLISAGFLSVYVVLQDGWAHG